MNALTARPMSLVLVEFQELYARHLCRHSQFGINVAHLAALFGIWYSVYGLVYWLTGLDWLVVAMAIAYLAVLVPNVPLRVLVATAAFLFTMLTAILAAPNPPFWVYFGLIPLCYVLQSWSHKVYTIEKDMTEFNRKYTKGSVLFVVLLFYEVPLVLNVLIFGRKDWAR